MTKAEHLHRNANAAVATPILRFVSELNFTPSGSAKFYWVIDFHHWLAAAGGASLAADVESVLHSPSECPLMAVMDSFP